MARGADLLPIDGDLARGAPDCVPEADCHRVFEIAAGLGLTRAGASSVEEVGEHVSEAATAVACL